MSSFAMWRRLDMPRHDAALLVSTLYGHLLQGIAVFGRADGPACLNYTVKVDHGWKARYGSVRGFLADRRIDHAISRETRGWYLDGASVPGLGHLVDLDYGFTPATNILQLQGLHPIAGKHSIYPQHGSTSTNATLTELPQTYQRAGERVYRYAAPSVPYEAELELSENGFVKHYPLLWIMEI